MTLLDALTAAVDCLVECDRSPRAVKVLTKKIERLREQRQRRAARHHCPRCGKPAENVTCWPCWQITPYRVRRLLESAKTEDAKRAAIRGVIEWAKADRAQLAAATPEGALV